MLMTVVRKLMQKRPFNITIFNFLVSKSTHYIIIVKLNNNIKLQVIKTSSYQNPMQIFHIYSQLYFILTVI